MTVCNDLSSFPSGISKSSNATCHLSIGNPASEEMNNCPMVTEDQQALKDLTNQPNVISSNVCCGGAHISDETQMLIILEEIQKANSQLDNFFDNLEAMEKTNLLLRRFQELAADTQ